MAKRTQIGLRDPLGADWLCYVSHHAGATPFHHPLWVETLRRCYRYRPFLVAATRLDGQLCSGLTVMEVSSLLTGRRWVALPFTDHFSAVSDDIESLTAVTAWLVDSYRAGAVPTVEMRAEFPVPTRGNEVFAPSDQFVLHRIPLAEGWDEDRVDRTHRQNARTAQRRGVVVERGTSVDHMRAYYRLHVETRRRLGVPSQPWSFFETLADTMLEPGLGSVLLARKDADTIAGLVLLHWNGYCIAKYAASRQDALCLRPNDLLFNTAITWAAGSGHHTFDFGRTELGNTGLRRYKQGWGAIETPLAYSVLSRHRPRSRSLPHSGGAAMRRLMRVSPTWVCTATGTLLYRHFG